MTPFDWALLIIVAGLTVCSVSMHWAKAFGSRRGSDQGEQDEGGYGEQ